MRREKSVELAATIRAIEHDFACVQFAIDQLRRQDDWISRLMETEGEP